MKSADRRQQGLAPLELIEQAIHQLRAAPPATLACYYVGALPLVLGVLFFWADMSRSAFAPDHLAGAALGVAALFLWMKFWQAVFARNLRAAFSGEPPPPLGLRQAFRIFIAQTTIQPSGLFMLPVTCLALLPAPWVFAFYQNLTSLAAAETGDLRPLLRKAARQATLWPRQNHLLLAILLAFGFYVFLNWLTVCLVLPGLVKMVFGAGSIFTRSPLSLLNTTFLAAMLGLTYLSVDPIIKAVYALRCFYGESLASGEDLKVELRRLALAERLAAVALALALLVSTATGAAATHATNTSHSSPPVPSPLASPPPAPPAPPATVSPQALDRTIEQVIQQNKYAWRMPREKLADSEGKEPGIIGRFLLRVRDFLRAKLKAFFQWLDDWLRRLFRHRATQSTSGYGWIMMLEILMYVLLAVVVIGLGLLLLYVLRGGRFKRKTIASQAILPASDLADESLGAEQLPEDGWTRLARELWERGELRLAVRAFYFASLACLAERNLISLAKFKSNRDYELELGRRGHAFPQMLSLFSENVGVFDRIWYGLHQINAELVSHFASNVERIKTAP